MGERGEFLEKGIRSSVGTIPLYTAALRVEGPWA